MSEATIEAFLIPTIAILELLFVAWVVKKCLRSKEITWKVWIVAAFVVTILIVLSDTFAVEGDAPQGMGAMRQFIRVSYLRRFF